MQRKIKGAVDQHRKAAGQFHASEFDESVMETLIVSMSPDDTVHWEGEIK